MFRTFSILTATTFLILTLGLQQATAQADDVLDIINESENHTVMADLLIVSELDHIVSEDGPYTVIAPTDEAFRSHGLDIEKLKDDSDLAHDMLVNHIFEGEVFSQDVENNMNINLIEEDIIALNGIVHVTDEIIEDQ
jgi:uncharacterized surface protein with fasciclin (FAS1) repeats